MSNHRFVRHLRYRKKEINQYMYRLHNIERETRTDRFYLLVLATMMTVTFLTLLYPGSGWLQLGVFGMLFAASGLLRCGYSRYVTLLLANPRGVAPTPASRRTLTPTEWESVLWFVYGHDYLKRLNIIVRYQIHEHRPG